MATETSTETVTPDAPGETSDETVTNQATQEADAPKSEAPKDVAPTQDQTLPDTHPLVKAFEAQKEELRKLKQSGQGAQEQAATELKKAQDALAALTPVQARYDRLEAFLTAVGGPLGKALDSKSFTNALFESDEDITDLVTKWNKDNPSATSSALKSGSGNTTGSSKDMNNLLRSAAK